MGQGTGAHTARATSENPATNPSRTAYRVGVTVWLTSDLHLGHVLVSGLRGFPNVAAHDATLATRWCERVAPDDTVWLLGDVVMGDWRAGLTLLSSLPGTKHLILGNHDRPHPAYRSKGGEWDLYAAVFTTMALGGELRVGSAKYLMSHFPYDGEGREGVADRHTQWRLRDLGVTLLHGHTHDAVVVRPSRKRTRMVHVGVDAHGLAPVALEDLPLTR